MSMDSTNIRLLSYNSTGFNPAKADFIRFLTTSLCTDIFCLQEHFLLRANVSRIQNEFKNFNSHILPATKKDNVLCSGRPSGGLGIFWKNSLNKLVKPVAIPNSNRIQAIDFNDKVIILNCYFPCDSQNNNFNDWELIKCLEEISHVITTYPSHHIVIAGDLNCDFARDSPFVNTVRNFIMNSQLTVAWWLYPIDFTYSFCHNNRSSFSTIDHFLFSNSSQQTIKEASVIHLGDNLSGHEPIFLSMSFSDSDSDLPGQPINTTEPTLLYKPCWNRASVSQHDNYKESLRQNIRSINISEGLLCNDVTCKREDHRSHIDSYCQSVLGAIDDATLTNIPPVSRPKEKKHPGWLKMVKPYQEDARFYHAVWVSYGKPLNCPLHDTMKRSRNSYHYAVRRLKRNAEAIKNHQLLEHCLNGNSTDLIKEFKKQNQCDRQNVTVIDGHCTDQNISNNFGKIYKDLYQSNNSSELLKDQIYYLESNINASNYSEVERLNPSVVYQAIESLKSCKNDNNFSFKSDAVINGKDVLTNYLTVLFQAFLIHGYIPHFILSATLQPIIKDKIGDKCVSTNYRAIGSSSLLLKLFDKIVLILFENSFKLSEQQFGFQKSSSTTLCSWAVKETVNYFLNRDTPVYACFLDMTKAFDLVGYSKLFSKLKNRLSPLFLRLLAFIYMNQTCDVMWNECRSPMFKVFNGVKQGGILSPTLFSIYVDDLFEILNLSGYGCSINDHFYGSVSYADDIVLLSPSVVGLQQMINITKNYFDNLDLIISLNTVVPAKSKTKCVAFGSKTNPFPLNLDGRNIPWSDSYTHLGHILYKDGTSDNDCMLKMRSFIGKYHSLCQVLKHKDPLVYMKLVSIYLCDFYGSNLWYLFGPAANKMYTMWNKMVRFIFHLPFKCHRYFIEPLSETSHLKTKLTDRFLKFYHSLHNNAKPMIRNLKDLQENDQRSEFGANVRGICLVNNYDSIFSVEKGSVRYNPIDNNNIWRVQIVKELLLVRQNNYLTLNFHNLEIENMLDYLACT